jgi:hypothetical protein
MKCSQKTCDEVAVLVYFWPGHSEPLYGCEHCGRQAAGVAEAMGFDLCLLPIELFQQSTTTPAIEPQAPNPATQERSEQPLPRHCVGCGEDCYLCPYKEGA